jgi:hypothetical protein
MGSGAFLVEVCRQLGDALVEAWHIHGELPTIPPDEDEVIFARRLVAQRCLYGVDRNPVAVDLAKMSLWLATLAKDHALTFVDHALRHGDSLVGLSRKQIEAFQWLPTGAVLRGLDVREPVDKVFELRRRIREADEGVTDWERRELWSEAQFELGKVRLVGDLVVAAFFTSQKPKDREAKRTEFASAVASGKAERYRGWLEECRHADPPLAPFHWEVEFPEVFDRDDAGFDAVIGNPPFLGGTRISTRISPAYMDYLKTMNVEAGDRADLVAYFFRRAFLMIRTAGAFGLIATNTIAQGDTRSVGLGWIRRHGGVIYHARRRHKWPGSAAVVVSIVHVAKMESRRPYLLDGHVVDRISAYLFHLGGDEEPSTLRSNQELCYSGVYPHGSGFQFDDTDQDATPVSTMHDLIRKNATNARIIHPYIGGQEILEDPRHRHVRFVINFEEMSLAEAAQWPDLLRILETKVKPKRIAAGGEVGAAPWWRFWRPRTEMLSALAPKTEYLAHPFTSSHLAFVFLPQGTLLAAPHLAFVLDVFGGFGILQSRLHECWVRFFASSLEDRLRYTPSDCFETFPSPQGGWVHPAVEAASKPYYEFRAALMLVNDEGLTKTYNRFHDPNHDGTGVDGRDQADVVRDIERLRKLHAAMDRAVLDAYGWADIPTDCQFLLDYEIEEEEQGDKKKPYRYRWPDEVRDEVMARLLELNRERAKEEGRFGAAATKKGKVPAKRGPKQADTKDLLS